MLVDLIEDCDQILVMSVNPGFGGQRSSTSRWASCEQSRALIDARNPDCDLEVDGGIGRENIERSSRPVPTSIVMGSSIFGAPDPRRRTALLRALAAAGRRSLTEDQLVAAIRDIVEAPARLGDATRAARDRRRCRGVATVALASQRHYDGCARRRRPLLVGADERARRRPPRDGIKPLRRCGDGREPGARVVAFGVRPIPTQSGSSRRIAGIDALARGHGARDRGRRHRARAGVSTFAITVVGEVSPTRLKRVPASLRATPRA